MTFRARGTQTLLVSPVREGCEFRIIEESGMYCSATIDCREAQMLIQFLLDTETTRALSLPLVVGADGAP